MSSAKPHICPVHLKVYLHFYQIKIINLFHTYRVKAYNFAPIPTDLYLELKVFFFLEFICIKYFNNNNNNNNAMNAPYFSDTFNHIKYRVSGQTFPFD